MRNVFIYFVIMVLAIGIFTVTSCETEPELELKFDPVCKIISPGFNNSFKKGSIITISVDASDENGQIIDVEFFIDKIYVGLTTETPYNYEWNTNDVVLGDHLISVLVKDNEGNIANDSVLVEIIEKEPIADFVYDKTEIKPWERIKFIDQSLNNPTTWNWDFGDGKTSVEQNPVHIYGTSGKYSVSLKVTNSTGTHFLKKEDIIIVSQTETGTLTDVDGNGYNTVKIGEQWWMAENLAVTNYNDGTSIPLVNSNDTWKTLSTPGYCWYNDEISNKEIYGAIYNWYVVETDKLCPTGWHVPSNEEWELLELTLGMDSTTVNSIGFRGTDEGDKLKASNGWFSSGNGTNESGFTALPGGYRTSDTGSFDNSEGKYGSFWTSSTAARVVSYENSLVSKTYLYKRVGVYIRCVKD